MFVNPRLNKQFTPLKRLRMPYIPRNRYIFYPKSWSLGEGIHHKGRFEMENS